MSFNPHRATDFRRLKLAARRAGHDPADAVQEVMEDAMQHAKAWRKALGKPIFSRSKDPDARYVALVLQHAPWRDLYGL